MKHKHKIRQLYYMINHDWQSLCRTVLLIGLVMLFVSVLLMATGLPPLDSEMQRQPLRYEQLVHSSGLPFLHLVAVLACLALTGLSWQRHFSPVRSLDRLYRLPLGIRSIFLIRILSGTMGLITIQFMQFMSLVLLYHLFYHGSSRIEPFSQGLYLAFRRSAYLRFLLPLNLFTGLLVISSALLLATLTLTCINLLRRCQSRLTAAFSAAVLASAAALIFLFAYRAHDSLAPEILRLLRLLPLLAGSTGLILLNQHWLHQRSLF